MGSDDRLAAVLGAIDAVNADDPNRLEVDGVARAKELVHGEMASAWVRQLDPGATELQVIAARAHHLRRWASPRADFPAGRAGYLRWRTAAKRRHADDVADLMAACGYRADEVAAVQRIIRKEGLGTDVAVQTHEDALCLVFLDTQLDDLADDLGDDKAIVVLAKTAAKMGAAGLAAAQTLSLSDRGARLLRSALAGPA